MFLAAADLPGTLYQTTLVLLGLCLLMIAVLWALRGGRLRRGAGPAEGAPPLRLLSRLPLPDGHAVYLVAVADEVLVVGGAPGGLSLLCRLPHTPTGPAPTGPAPTGPAPTGPAPTGPAPAALQESRP